MASLFDAGWQDNNLDIIVCVKQVPGASSVEIDPVTGVLKREGVEAKLNPYDLFAVEAALIFAAKLNGKVTAVSMGPPQARNALLETIYMGADHAVLISDSRFAGSDVLATANTLAQAINACGFDLVVCGKQTTDGDTAQVGAELAELLGVPHATGVLSFEPEVSGLESGGAEGGGIVITSGQDSHIATQYMPLPCLLCMDGGINTPRLPSYKRKREISADPVRLMTLSDFKNRNEEDYGISGSPTQVERTFVPETNIGHEVIEGSGEQLAERLAAVLSERKFL